MDEGGIVLNTAIPLPFDCDPVNQTTILFESETVTFPVILNYEWYCDPFEDNFLRQIEPLFGDVGALFVAFLINIEVIDQRQTRLPCHRFHELRNDNNREYPSCFESNKHRDTAPNRVVIFGLGRTL